MRNQESQGMNRVNTPLLNWTSGYTGQSIFCALAFTRCGALWALLHLLRLLVVVVVIRDNLFVLANLGF
jgi:hypothetical protein